MKFMDSRKAALLPIQHLAWIGDAVYEIYSRHHLVLGGAAPGRSSHRASARLTSAQGQAHAAGLVQGRLSQEEADILRRGRNAKGLPRSTPEYCQATGLEAIIGWLWLSNQHQRLEEILAIILTEGETDGG